LFGVVRSGEAQLASPANLKPTSLFGSLHFLSTGQPIERLRADERKREEVAGPSGFL
jgi:hypothetical protein